MLVLSITLICVLGLTWRLYESQALYGATPAPRKAVPRARAVVQRSPAPVAAAAPAARAPLEWTAPTSKARADAAPAAAAPRHDGEALARKLRDRYIAARFPGVARGAADLERIEQVIKGARLYFEEDKYDRALELLDMAILQCPADESLPLARLELAFLARADARFIALARDFHALRPLDPRWDEIRRLGRALDRAEPLFQSTGDAAQPDSSGPWPDMPNWIQASWDLTPEVRAADFHQAMALHAARVS
jgi:hypothetical protein